MNLKLNLVKGSFRLKKTHLVFFSLFSEIFVLRKLLLNDAGRKIVVIGVIGKSAFPDCNKMASLDGILDRHPELIDHEPAEVSSALLVSLSIFHIFPKIIDNDKFFRDKYNSIINRSNRYYGCILRPVWMHIVCKRCSSNNWRSNDSNNSRHFMERWRIVLPGCSYWLYMSVISLFLWNWIWLWIPRWYRFSEAWEPSSNCDDVTHNCK